MIKKLLMLLIIIAFVSCKKEPQEFKEERFLFGTYIQITVFDDSSSHAKKLSKLLLMRYKELIISLIPIKKEVK